MANMNVTSYFAKLGNTMFNTGNVVGMQVSKSNGSPSHPYKITIYFDVESLKTISFPLKSAEQADIICKVLTNNTVVDLMSDALQATHAPRDNQ